MASLYTSSIYLVFKPHETQIDVAIEISREERRILRDLASAYSEIAALPVHAERKGLWRQLNDLQPVRPMVWIDEVCWHEMNVEDELTLKTRSTFCRRLEVELRKTLYQWRHMPGDMILDPVIYSPCILDNTGFGLPIEAEICETSPDSDIASRHFIDQILSEEDIEKIKVPKVTHHPKRTEEFLQAYEELFDGIVKVEKRGVTSLWFAPWDEIVYWMGADHLLLNLADKPMLMHRLIDHFVTAYEKALEQYIEQNLLALNNTNVRIGSGAYGYTAGLPQPGWSRERIRTIDQWGHAAAQIFGSVSPRMHAEFGLDYEMRWLKRFGLVYYGCCEPLHNKLEMLSRVPNLRKVSVSPWADIASAARQVCGRYVLSVKPSPALLAFDHWDSEGVRQQLLKLVRDAKGNNLELVLKDISTVRRQPQRLWEWARIASELAQAAL